MDSERGCPRVEAARSSSAAAREAASASRPEHTRCNAVTGSLGRRTSTRSIDEDARRRAAISSSTGSRVTRTPRASPGSVSRFHGLGRDGRRAQPREAVAARGMARAPSDGSRRVTTTSSRRVRVSQSRRRPVGRTGSSRRSARYSRRRAREVRRDRSRPCVALDVRLAHAGRDVQVPPELLAVRTRRVPGVRARPRERPRVLAHPPLQPVEPRRGGLREGPDAVSARRLAESAHVILGGVLSPLENVLTEVLIWLHDTGGLTWAWSIVALTVIVRILLVPVAVRQIHSMQSLQIHAPEMKADPAALQARPAEAVGRAHEVLQGEQDQPVRLLPSDRLPDPDLHRPLLRAARLREGDLPAASRRRRSSGSASSTSRADERRLGAGAHLRVRGESAHVHLPHVDGDAEQGAALHDHVPPDRLPPLHPGVPDGPDDLLAHDEPLDDGAGDRHATPDAEAGSAAQALEPDASQRGNGDRLVERRAGPTRTSRRLQARVEPPRRVKRKRGGGRPRR